MKKKKKLIPHNIPLENRTNNNQHHGNDFLEKEIDNERGLNAINFVNQHLRNNYCDQLGSETL